MKPPFFWTAGAASPSAPKSPQFNIYRDRHEIIEGSKWLYRLIGAQHFQRRFDLFRSFETSALLPPFARDNHPVEYGLFLCLERPDAVEHVPSGYLAWADSFCGVTQYFKQRHSKPEWKKLRGDILSGLGVAEGGNHDSLNAIFFQLRFGQLFGPGGSMAPSDSDYQLLLGSSAGLTADFVLKTPKKNFGIDCKSLRNGPLRSNWDHHLTRILSTSPAVRHFIENSTGLALITLPRLDFLATETGARNFTSDLDAFLKNYGNSYRVITNSAMLSAPATPDQVRNLINARTPFNHNSHLITTREQTNEHYVFSERRAYLACFTPSDQQAFANNVQRAATKVITKQVGKNGLAIVAYNLDYLTAFRSDPKHSIESIQADQISAIIDVQRAILADPVCRTLYGVVFWADQPLQSTDIWAHDIGVGLRFWRNAHSPFAAEPVPPPFNSLTQIEYDETTFPVG